eukprot:NODE_1410_length_2487_cov_4.675000.p1 GENE.NODE_1410_length_2487_cov_4.675000~~NODE_1410_length_2487_cov_4.675000.p1  ORF type:complete len:767 (-),score=219.84 NODE_1410_length_2487_cov_4.675000:69-2369(-)
MAVAAAAALGVTPSTGIVVAAGAAGAAVGGGAVLAHHKMAGLVNQHHGKRAAQQMAVICDLCSRTLSVEAIMLPSAFDPEKGLELTLAPLHDVSAAWPQVKLAFDAILDYQSRRMRAIIPAIYGHTPPHFFKSKRHRNDPRAVVCELVKLWLCEKIEDRGVQIREVQGYRNFCRGFVHYQHDVFKQRNKVSFVETMSHVSRHLTDLMSNRLKESRSGAECLDQLHGEVYHFVLQSMKLLLFGATDFRVGDELYCTNSIELLRRTAVPPELLEGFERKAAISLEDSWDTECGALIRLLLGTKHVSDLCSAREGISREESKILSVQILRGTSLPSSRMGGTVDPFVRVKATRDGRVLSRGRTSTIKNNENPEWAEVIVIDFPEKSPGVPAALRIEIGDDSDLLGESLFGGIELDQDEVHSLMLSGEEFTRPVLPLGKASRKCSSATLAMSFEAPDFKSKVEGMRRAWKEEEDAARRDRTGHISTPAGSGLIYIEAAMPFLDATTALENAVYFLDIIVAQCGDVARRMGDLGVVLVAPVLGPLLDEAEQSVVTAEAAAQKLYDDVYNIHVKQARDRKSKRRPSTMDDRAREEAQKAAHALSALLERIRTTFAQLRAVFARYDCDSKHALQEAAEHIENLRSRIMDENTVRRTGRLTSAVQSLPQVNPESAIWLQVEDDAATLKATEANAELGRPYHSLAAGAAMPPPKERTLVPDAAVGLEDAPARRRRRRLWRCCRRKRTHHQVMPALEAAAAPEAAGIIIMPEAAEP